MPLNTRCFEIYNFYFQRPLSHALNGEFDQCLVRKDCTFLFRRKVELVFNFTITASGVWCLGCKLKSNGNQITRRGRGHVIYRGERCRAAAKY